MIAALTVFASSQALVGKYEFYEDGGKTVGGAAVFVGHVLEIGSDGTATLRADGYQTSRDLNCTFTMNEAKTVITFQSYNDEGVNSFQPYKKGDILMTLRNKTVKGKKVLWTIFDKYEPVIKVAPKSGGIYFKVSKGKTI